MENDKMTNDILDTLKNAGYDCAVAIATDAEIKAQAACGQLSIITEDEKDD
jgi:adenine C2-methylase RlmN of 23S rRNA A2503 and tRNA A37